MNCLDTTYSLLLTLYYLLFTTDSQGNESAARVVELRVADELPVLSIGLGADDFNRYTYVVWWCDICGMMMWHMCDDFVADELPVLSIGLGADDFNR